MSRLTAFADRVLLSHWRWIDERYIGKREGRLSDHARAWWTLGVSALVLCFMQYITLSSPRLRVPSGSGGHAWLTGGMKRAVSLELPGLLEGFSQELGQLVYRYSSLVENVAWAFGCIFFYFFVPAVVIRVVFRERLRDHGLSPAGFLRHLWIYVVLFIPVGALVWIVSHSDAFLSRYPFYKHPVGLTDFLVWECAYALQFLSLEFFFRGFMITGLRHRLGHNAIFVMVVPYMMIHFQKPFLETVGAIIAGTVLGTLALRTRSIWGGVAIHVAVAVAMDVAALVQKGWEPLG